MPSFSSPILAAEQRAFRSWFADGLSTLVAGVGCLVVAFFLLYDHDRPVTPLSIAITFLVFFLYGAVLLRQRQIVEWLKSRITYPRTGYALPPSLAEDPAAATGLTVLSLQATGRKRSPEAEKVDADRRRHVMIMAVAVTVAISGMMLVQNRWSCAVAGALITVSLWYGARKEQWLSWVTLGGLPLVGFAMSIFYADHVEGPQRPAYFLVGTGVVFVLDGGLTLLRYLWQNPRPKPTQS